MPLAQDPELRCAIFLLCTFCDVSIETSVMARSTWWSSLRVGHLPGARVSDERKKKTHWQCEHIQTREHAAPSSLWEQYTLTRIPGAATIRSNHEGIKLALLFKAGVGIISLHIASNNPNVLDKSAGSQFHPRVTKPLDCCRGAR